MDVAEQIVHKHKLEYMAMWAMRHKVTLTLEGEVGFGRECVGILDGDQYPAYHWYDRETYDQLDNNGDVWIPENAYHKHECVAVLGRGEPAESQLYEWLKWFETNGFVLETGTQEVDPKLGAIAYIMGQHKYARMVRPAAQSIAVEAQNG